MKIILDTHSTNPEYNGECDCAVVEITPELMAVIQRRVAIAREAVEEDRDLIELYFWDAAAAYYDQGLIGMALLNTGLNCNELLQ